MITISYDAHATVCDLMSVVWEDPKRKWIVIKVVSYPSEEMQNRMLSDLPIDIACPDINEGEVQYNTCKVPTANTDEYADLYKVVNDNWPEDDEPLTEFVFRSYEKKVKL